MFSRHASSESVPGPLALGSGRWSLRRWSRWSLAGSLHRMGGVVLVAATGIGLAATASALTLEIRTQGLNISTTVHVVVAIQCAVIAIVPDTKASSGRAVGGSAKSLTTTTRSNKRNLLQGQSQGTHELGATAGTDGVVVPVGLVSDSNIEQKFVEVTNTTDADAKIGLEVTGILGQTDELLHLKAEQLNILERCIK
ncbi:hypothetical protein HG531_001891 [Fusarium graminearum]|nr:hypothetical protein HG531_001891 [Fusarium graminearum]